MKIKALSDTHGYLPKVGECEVLILAGDVTPIDYQRDNDRCKEWFENDFKVWIKELPCNKVIFTPGNHDFYIARVDELDLHSEFEGLFDGKLRLLINDSYKYKGCVFYGCPYIKPIFFQEDAWAFSSNDPAYYEIIKDNIDVLITHDSPYHNGNVDSMSKNIKYHFYGHHHEGIEKRRKNRYNCAYLNNAYSQKDSFKIVEVEVISQAEHDRKIRNEYLEDIIHDVESMYVTCDESEANKYFNALEVIRSFREEELLKYDV